MTSHVQTSSLQDAISAFHLRHRTPYRFANWKLLPSIDWLRSTVVRGRTRWTTVWRRRHRETHLPNGRARARRQRTRCNENRGVNAKRVSASAIGRRTGRSRDPETTTVDGRSSNSAHARTGANSRRTDGESAAGACWPRRSRGTTPAASPLQDTCVQVFRPRAAGARAPSRCAAGCVRSAAQVRVRCGGGSSNRCSVARRLARGRSKHDRDSGLRERLPLSQSVFGLSVGTRRHDRGPRSRTGSRSKRLSDCEMDRRQNRARNKNGLVRHCRRAAGSLRRRSPRQRRQPKFLYQLV